MKRVSVLLRCLTLAKFALLVQSRRVPFSAASGSCSPPNGNNSVSLKGDNMSLLRLQLVSAAPKWLKNKVTAGSMYCSNVIYLDFVAIMGHTSSYTPFN